MAALRRVLTWAVVLGLLAGCASQPPSAEELRIRQSVLEAALGEIGRPYRYGGADTDGFDCSGLVHYSYAEAGVDVPRSAAQLKSAGRKIDLDDALPGDLLFYDFGGLFSHSLHVTVYVGDGRFVHAPNSHSTVVLQSVDAPGWSEHYIGARRILP